MTGKTKGFFRWFLFGALVLSLAGLTGCGSDNEEASALGVFHRTVVQGGAFDNDVALFDNSASMKGQILLLADEIQGSGNVTAVSFRFYGQSTGNSVENVTIKMGHTAPRPGDNLSMTFAENVENGKGSLVTVYGPAPLGIPGGPDNTVFTIPLNGKFNYNGVDDLVIQITAGRSSKGTLIRGHQTSPARIALVGTDNAAAAVASDSGESLPDVKITFAGGVNNLDAEANAVNYIPFSISAWHRVQMLYTAKEIDGAGLINGLAVVGELDNVASGMVFKATVRIGHTKKGLLEAGFDNNFNAGPAIKVADNVTVTAPTGFSTYGQRELWIPFKVPFGYNGVDNLVVEVSVHSGASADSSNFLLWATTNGVFPVGTRLYATQDNAVTGSLDTVHYSTKLRFAGATVDVIATNGPVGSDTYPFALNDNVQQQFLYLPGELGMKGTITKFAFRMDNTSTAAAYPNVRFRMAYRDNTLCGLSFAGNMTSPVTVFNGTFNFPADLKRGDWVEVPLTTPFSYDPSRGGLIIDQVTPPAPTTGNRVSAGISTEYIGRNPYRSGAPDNNASNIANFLEDLRLTIQ